MNNIEIYSAETVAAHVRKRDNELKIGEQVQAIGNRLHWQEELKACKATFVLLGIPEDIGVKANYGRGGSYTAWKPALESFLNQQDNQFLDGSDILVLGHIVTNDLMALAEQPGVAKDITVLRELVAEIDNRVAQVIQAIVSAGKIPLVVGGGHNNAYGNIKGAAMALGEKINAINCDPHTDFRPLEGRHSGNGFSYAFHEQYLHKYAVYCMHEQYNTHTVLKDFTQYPGRLYYSTYEDIFVREAMTAATALQQTIGFVKQAPCGIEIDLDAITNVPSSAKTSSGLSPVQARQYIYQCGRQLNGVYLHIAEGAPVLSHIKADNKTGKLIAYLLSDFIKGVKDRFS